MLSFWLNIGSKECSFGKKFRLTGRAPQLHFRFIENETHKRLDENIKGSSPSAKPRVLERNI
jgi:hypothetical protein